MTQELRAPVSSSPSLPLGGLWRQSVPFFVGATIRVLRGRDRRRRLRELAALVSRPTVDAALEWSDPVPGLVHGLTSLRHPRALVRPFLREPLRWQPPIDDTAVDTGAAESHCVPNL